MEDTPKIAVKFGATDHEILAGLHRGPACPIYALVSRTTNGRETQADPVDLLECIAALAEYENREPESQEEEISPEDQDHLDACRSLRLALIEAVELTVCPRWLTYDSPDAIAECVPGINDDIYKELWANVVEVKCNCTYHEIDAHPETKMPVVWPKLSDEAKRNILEAEKAEREKQEEMGLTCPNCGWLNWYGFTGKECEICSTALFSGPPELEDE